MQKLTKIVSRQDANFKLSPSSSNETSVNLPKEISALISDESGEITFKIFKEDFIKAISGLCLIPKIYHKKDSHPSLISDIFMNLSKQLIAQFGEAETSFYTVYHFKREDGRSYFNNLKQANSFNLRAFLVEEFSYLTFIKDENGDLILRVETTTPNDELPQECIQAKEQAKKDNQDNLPLQQIFYGAPGTGKSFTIDGIADDENSVRTTFHPDSDYASFVGAYKPTMEDVPMSKTFTSSKEGTYAEYVQKTDSHPGTERKIVYKYVPQAFLKAYVEAWQDLGNPHYLIIEEINRGNCAQIFGDLFQLLDRNSQGASSYAIHADEDIRQFLSKDENGFAKLTNEQKYAISGFVLEKDNRQRKAIGDKILSGEMLLLPPNLHIWATMNTSDQSLFPIDSAFKRRWDWKYVPIDYNPKDIHTGEPLDWKFQIGDNLYSWGEFLKVINPEIYTITESSDKQMGYFFAKANRETGVIPQDVFLNKILFYLWTDVFKDYDVSSDLFKNSQENRSFRFTDFFGEYAQEALENFIANFNLNAEEVDSNSTNEDGYSSIKVKIKGKFETSITQSMIAILRDAASNHSMTEIEVTVKECISRGEDPIIKRIDNPESYTKENRWNPTIIYSSDGVPFVVTTMWNRRFLPMIEKLATHFNMPFEVINE